MPAVASLAAAASSSSSAGASQSSLLNKSSPLVGPALLASYAVFRQKDAVTSRCEVFKAHISRSSSTLISCQSNLPALPKLSISATADRLRPQLSACTSKGNLPSHFSGVSSSHFGDQEGVLHGIPALPRRHRSLRPPSAYKNDFFTFKYPKITEKPEWWWRTLACVPYLIALQISYAGYLFQPLVQRYEVLGDLIFYVPGAITRFPPWFIMVYSYCVYIWIVKSKDWPHYFRFHAVMGMLLEILLQVFWTASNFFPLIHYEGLLGMYYWAAVGLAYILLTLICIRSALLGGYVNIPIISDAAYIHTLFFIGGYQRPS